jgi:two-component system sensor histidine kinase KdpD
MAGRQRGLGARLCAYAAAVLGVGLVTALIALLQPAGAGRFQMIYLLLVLALAVTGGSGPAIVASFLSLLAFDWFFVRPIGNLSVGDPEEWLTLGLFLIVGITTGSLAARLKRSAAEARRRSRETATLYELSSELLAGTNLAAVLSVVAERLTSVLYLQGAAVRLLDDDGQLGVVAATGRAELRRLIARDSGPSAGPHMAGPRTSLVESRARESSAGPIYGTHVPLVLNGRTLGVLTAYTAGEPRFGENELRLLRAFAAETALAVGRVRLLEEEERVRTAEESDRMKSVFLASVSHDLRTPITTIKTAAALLLSRPDPGTEEEATSRIDHEADRLDHLVGNLLEMSRIEAGATTPRPALEDLAELVGATAERFAPLLDGRRLTLSASPELPLVPIDAPQIARVLTNLLENAVKFSPAGSEIRIDLSQTGDSPLLRVHNAGPPIPADEQQRIFDKFHRIQVDSSHAGGTGLGLAICRGIVEAHGGRIWTANEDGGVSFYVTLPGKQPNLNPASIAAIPA